MHRLFILLIIILLSIAASAQQGNLSEYDSIPGDPLKARIYTLDNGLKVYLSVHKDEPRFQSMIGVKAGSKHDPATHSGLAHYLEHMLFKGTDVYGTSDYQKEAPLIDSIFSLFEKYGNTKDSAHRTRIYQSIDSISGIAARYAIPNEFDKMMAGMGVTKVNAYTSNEQTVYINDVPSNQLENFLTVEAERFRKPVMRLFHTELEAVYEEKNRSLDSDASKVFENLFRGLFENHQYGKQTTIGTIEHLKNPSLKAIKEYYDTYYVPNNMVIALSGDFNPDSAISVIREKFGSMVSKDIPVFKVAQEKFIKNPVVKEVYGPDAASLTMGFRFGGASSEDADVLTIVDYILSNGQAGLLDINLNNKQKVLSSSSSTIIMKDYSVHVFSARPREGQSLEQVRDLLMEQIMELKTGNFPDWLIPAIAVNMKLEQEQAYENNYARASAMLNSEIQDLPYSTSVNRLNRLSKINKQQVIDFVRKWYGDNYVIVYKRTGVDENTEKVIKPSITPVPTNNDKQSDFLKKILNSKAKEIEPTFIDFERDIVKSELKKGIPVFMVKNNDNHLFSLTYQFNMGYAHDRRWPVICQYINYIGNGRLTSTQIKEEFYKLGCSFFASAAEDQIKIQMEGIQDNFVPALQLLESILSDPTPDEKALENLKNDILKSRVNAKLNKGEILSRLTSYAMYGPTSPATYLLGDAELKTLKGYELTVLLRNLTGFVHEVSYYGPMDSVTVMTTLSKFHNTPRGLQSIPAFKKFELENTEDGKIFFINYDMKQAEINFIAKGGGYSKELQPKVLMYSRYFGGGMSSPVFQVLRESKALAYAVNSRYNPPSRLDRPYFSTAYIGTQADKLPEAAEGMMELLRNMPMSEQDFETERVGVLQSISTDKISKSAILRSYHAQRKMGHSHDIRRDIYEEVKRMKAEDIVAFHKDFLKGRKYRLAIIGNKELLDLKSLEKYGEIQELQLNDIFGY